MPLLNVVSFSEATEEWPSTSGTVTALVTVLTFLVAVLSMIGLYFLRKNSMQYAKSTSRGRLQYSMSFLYVSLILCSLLETSISAWLLAQYAHQDRFPSVGTRDGLRIALFAACWTLSGAGIQMFLLLRPPQWVRKHSITAVAGQTVWAILTWAVWVAATRTIQRASPVLSAKMNCAGADYCTQLHAAFVFALLEILILAIGVVILAWSMWKITRYVPRRRPSRYR